MIRKLKVELELLIIVSCVHFLSLFIFSFKAFKFNFETRRMYNCFGNIFKFHKNRTCKNYSSPLIYDSNYLSKFIIALQNYKWNLLYVDINYHLETIFPSYFNTIFRNARKNLKTAELNNLRFKNNFSKEIKSAYQIIKNNRKAKNYPLKLSLSEVLKTIKIILTIFIVYQNNIGVAAAQVFHINNIVQVIYWRRNRIQQLKTNKLSSF